MVWVYEREERRIAMMNARGFIIMVSRNKAKILLRCIAVAFWGLVWWKGATWFVESGLEWRALPHALKIFMREAGMWGPIVLILAYIVRTFLFLPSSILEVAAGSVYGPFFGTILNCIGANISAALAFGIGRVLGRDFFTKHEHGRLRVYDEALTKDGFSAVLILRVLFVPFDVVNYGAGMTGMKFRDYMAGTVLGSLPAIVAFTVAGDRIGKPRGLLIFILLASAIITLVFFVKRHPWAKRIRSNTHHE